MTYAPQPGTAAYRIVAWLEAQGRTKEFNSAQIAYALHLDAKGLPTQLAPALQAGIVFRRQKDGSSPRAPFWYSLTDHGAVHRREFRPAPKDWMQRPGSDEDASAGPPASDGAASEGTADTPGFGQPEAAPDTPQGDQAGSEPAREVMEPEACESASGRGTTGAPALATLPLHASPGVGPMGAGQPADAGPTTEDQRSGGGGARPAAAGCTGTDGSPLRGPLPGRHSQDAGLAPGPLHHVEQPREVDAQFAASLRAAMNVDVDDDCLARGAELGRRKSDQLSPADLAATRRAVHAPPAFRAARFSDGSLATERDGVVVEVYSAAETDAIQKLLGVRT